MWQAMSRFFIALMLVSLTGCQYLATERFFSFKPSDPEITVSVHERLKNTPALAPFTFHIETADGTVYLSGYVKTIRQSDMAGAITARIAGVKAVENNIIVRK